MVIIENRHEKKEKNGQKKGNKDREKTLISLYVHPSRKQPWYPLAHRSPH